MRIFYDIIKTLHSIIKTLQYIKKVMHAIMKILTTIKKTFFRQYQNVSDIMKSDMMLSEGYDLKALS